MPPILTAIHRFPVKSMRGEPLDECVVEPWGLADDRRWMVIGDDDEALTAREVNSMLLLRPRLGPDGSLVIADDQNELVVERPNGDPIPVTVHGKPAVGVPAPAADEWLSAVLGHAARLVLMVDPTNRPINPAFSRPEDRVSFADAYPVLVTTEESLAALNDRVLERHRGEHPPLPMTRFRPNLVIAGAEAWAEDGWRRFRVGEAIFRAVKGCDRCVMTTVDPETARRGKEPIATLAGFRRWDGATWFGMNLIPDTPGAVIRVGDEVEILDAADHSDGPPRPGRPS